MIREQFLPLSRPDISDAEINAVTEVLRSGWWTTGPIVTEFENRVAEYLKEDRDLFTVALTSCTAGLHLSLVVLGIGPGDEVIVPTWTFAATAQIVEWVGAKVVLCDIEDGALNIDIRKAEKLINKKTKAIIPVHIAGYPCDLEGIKYLASKYKIKVVEDAAHAFGAKYQNQKIGNFSDLSVFSFYATKNLATGEGGMVVSRDKALVEKIRKKSYFGINKEAFKRYEKSGNWFYDIEECGYKYNFDSIHAAIGIAQIKRIEQMLARRREIAYFYRDRLKNYFSFTDDSSEHRHAYHLFLVRSTSNQIGRDDIVNELKTRNIGSSVHYIPLHLHSYYKDRFPKDDFPVANAVFSGIFSIPLFSSMLLSDAEYVADSLIQILRGV